MLEGKIWRITYATEDRGKIDAKAKKGAASRGMDFTKPEVQKKILAGAASESEKAVEQAKKDLEQMLTWWKKNDWKMEERFDLPAFKVNSTVVRLNSGGLLLYAPSRIREEEGFAGSLKIFLF